MEIDAFPTIKPGKQDVTRLIAGYNPIGGDSHSVPKLTALMKDWFTLERTSEYVHRCERNGIDTWHANIDKKVFAAPRGLGQRLQNEVNVPHSSCRRRVDERHGVSAQAFLEAASKQSALWRSCLVSASRPRHEPRPPGSGVKRSRC